jgi:hypothetical protein
MNKLFVMMFGLSLSAAVFAHGDLKPIHGGQIIEGKKMTVELVAQPEMVTVFLSEHEKLVDTKNATGEVILLNGGRKQVITLSPAGENSLKGNGVTLEKSAKAIVKIKVPEFGEEQVRFAF